MDNNTQTTGISQIKTKATTEQSPKVPGFVAAFLLFLFLAVLFGAIAARQKHRFKKEEKLTSPAKFKVQNSLYTQVKWSMVTTCLACTVAFTVAFTVAVVFIIYIIDIIKKTYPDIFTVGFIVNTLSTHKKYCICIACSFLVLFALSIYIHLDLEDFQIENKESDKMKSIKHDSLVSTILSAVAFVCVALLSLALYIRH